MEKQDRVIFHADCNAFYASVEEVLYPQFREVPMAVCGDPEKRRGVILAKNERAKKYGIRTAETVYQARQKCPDLVLRPARHSLYREFCGRVNAIYLQYTDQVEKASIDESYLDVTGSLHLFGGDAETLAYEILERVQRETGLTISIGCSFCKTFAKIGSDMKKPNAVTMLTRENYREVLWALPVGAMLHVGAAKQAELLGMGITTIGELARCDVRLLEKRLGAVGEQLHRYTNGGDHEPVLRADEMPPPKSIGSNRTYERNLETTQDIRVAVLALADDVATRLRKHGFKCLTVHVTVKSFRLEVKTRQRQLDKPTWLAADLYETALELILELWRQVPIRMLSVTATKLLPGEEAVEQQSIFETAGDADHREKQERLELTMDRIREKYGGGSIVQAGVAYNDLGIYDDDQLNRKSDQE